MFAPTPLAAASTRSIGSVTDNRLGFVMMPEFLSRSPLSSANVVEPSDSKIAAMPSTFFIGASVLCKGDLEQYSLSVISALAERAVAALEGESPIGDRFYAGGRPGGPFARCHTDSTRERTQTGAAAIRSS